jgi:hypothetical protein
VGVVEEEFELRGGTWTVIGARVGVGPERLSKGCMTLLPGTGATSEPVPLTGAKGSYVGYASAVLLFLQEERRSARSRTPIVKRDGTANIGKILPKRDNE